MYSFFSFFSAATSFENVTMDLPEELQVVRPALTVTKRDHTYQYNPGEKRGASVW